MDPEPDLDDMEIDEVCPDCGEAIEDCDCDEEEEN